MDLFHRAVIVACYLFGVLVGGPILLIERKSRLIRFHAAQALFFHVALLAIFVPISCVGVAIYLNLHKVIGISIMGLATGFEIVMLIAWVYALVMALIGKTPRLPLFARLADRASMITS